MQYKASNLNLLFFVITLFFTSQLDAQKVFGSKIDAVAIGKKASLLSYYIMDRNPEKIADIYTHDGKLFPNNTEILSGRTAIIKFWTPNENETITHHKIMPEEIRVLGDEAYDYGYYEGITTFNDGTISTWRGKYVTTWKKIDGDWKLYLDIWNRIKDD
jgi:uncharacterized protein (TIGR02246 family)